MNLDNCVTWINCVGSKEGNSLSLEGTAPHLKSYQQITVLNVYCLGELILLPRHESPSIYTFRTELLK